MNISEARQANTSGNNSRSEQPEAAKPPRYADWISYATALTQQSQTASQASR
jgi:hypothetical protein